MFILMNIGIQIYGNAVDVWLFLTVVGYANVKDGRIIKESVKILLRLGQMFLQIQYA